MHTVSHVTLVKMPDICPYREAELTMQAEHKVNIASGE